MSRIFISYRREDTAAYAGRLADQLSLRFGHETFMDVDSISAGEDFVRAIEEKLASCEVLVVVIGRAWLSAATADGHLRLTDPNDVVSMEITTALDRQLRVIPVLVGGAVMPTVEQLPKALAPLCRRNALEISDARFHEDVKRLSAATEASKPSTVPDRNRYKRSIQVLSVWQVAGAWFAFILSMSGGGSSGGDDGLLGMWVVLWLTGAILIELSRRSKLREGIFLGIVVPLALMAEVALESRTS